MSSTGTTTVPTAAPVKVAVVAKPVKVAKPVTVKTHTKSTPKAIVLKNGKIYRRPTVKKDSALTHELKVFPGQVSTVADNFAHFFTDLFKSTPKKKK